MSSNGLSLDYSKSCVDCDPVLDLHEMSWSDREKRHRVLHASIETAPKGKHGTTCWGCEKTLEKVSKCGKCLISVYCGPGCQRSDWKFFHKKECETLKRKFGDVYNRGKLASTTAKMGSVVEALGSVGSCFSAEGRRTLKANAENFQSPSGFGLAETKMLGVRQKLVDSPESIKRYISAYKNNYLTGLVGSIGPELDRLNSCAQPSHSFNALRERLVSAEERRVWEGKKEMEKEYGELHQYCSEVLASAVKLASMKMNKLVRTMRGKESPALITEFNAIVAPLEEVLHQFKLTDARLMMRLSELTQLSHSTLPKQDMAEMPGFDEMSGRLSRLSGKRAELQLSRVSFLIEFESRVV